jgi:hypothetical protein
MSYNLLGKVIVDNNTVFDGEMLNNTIYGSSTVSSITFAEFLTNIANDIDLLSTNLAEKGITLPPSVGLHSLAEGVGNIVL